MGQLTHKQDNILEMDAKHLYTVIICECNPLYL